MATNPRNGRQAAEQDQEAVDQAERAELMRQQHKRRLLAAIDKGYRATGIRLAAADPKNDVGLVVTFDEAEGKAVAEHIRSLVEARK